MWAKFFRTVIFQNTVHGKRAFHFVNRRDLFVAKIYCLNTMNMGMCYRMSIRNAPKRKK